MIFDEIVLHNFGVYGERQSLCLSPPSPSTPIVLLGGLNGAGKTTFLDALQLALYGKLARCSNRGVLAYDEYLRRCIHRATDPSEGASLEVQFRHNSDGEEHVYRIHRSWSVNGNGVKERMEVLRDGTVDRVLAGSWNEQVEAFMPLRISHLFFFDGEKIESLADFENSAQLLSTAIRSLLGLDIVERLTTDLIVFERRKQISLKTDVDRRQIEDAQAAVNRLEKHLEELVRQQNELGVELEYREKRLHEIENEFRLQGGELFEQQTSLEAQRAEIESNLREVEEQLRETASGPAPLLMVVEYLERINQQCYKEHEIIQSEIFSQTLAERDAQLLENIKQHGADKGIINAAKRFLVKDRSRRVATKEGGCYLNLSVEDIESLRLLQTKVLPDIQIHVDELLQQAEGLQAALIDLDRKLASIPAEDTVAHLIESREKARAAIDESRRRLEIFGLEIERVKRERDQKNASLIAQIEKAVEQDFEQEDISQKLLHSRKARQTLAKFRDTVVKHHVTRIERLVMGSLRHLLHKESLVSDLRIDPEHFSIELRGADGRVLSPDRLSAGERQLLAISILWGLARAADRQLPAIIDTPLGRLDASHRERLVERYFPHASHQVLLLSTDKEINNQYYEKLKPWIGRSYSLEFDDSIGATRIQPGYFM
ncbi:MAG TPA: DNA sulfur modification protein DndD [Blastocatellia bacterium]|nr:DNA sulfur modification protein DndD [Blastocatellia bacterium]